MVIPQQQNLPPAVLVINNPPPKSPARYGLHKSPKSRLGQTIEQIESSGKKRRRTLSEQEDILQAPQGMAYAPRWDELQEAKFDYLFQTKTDGSPGTGILPRTYQMSKKYTSLDENEKLQLLGNNPVSERFRDYVVNNKQSERIAKYRDIARSEENLKTKQVKLNTIPFKIRYENGIYPNVLPLAMGKVTAGELYNLEMYWTEFVESKPE